MEAAKRLARFPRGVHHGAVGFRLRVTRLILPAVMLVLIFGMGGIFAASARAGGGPENVLLIIDQTNLDSLYVGHYYQRARNIPARNVLYMDPVAASFLTQTQVQLVALSGTLANRELRDHIDYIVIPPGGLCFVPASGLVTDGCSPVSRFSVASVYSLAKLSEQILAGLPMSHPNGYFTENGDAVAFDAAAGWSSGQPTASLVAPRYYLGAMLGYTGERGNTVDEIIAMIDRSVAVDGTHPVGTFYFMETEDVNRSGPRHGLFPAATASLGVLGASAEHLLDVLPMGRHDCLGIMTGAASPGIDSADLTIQPGAFCDHLTSFAAHFGTSSQEKVSRWIAKGASGSFGAVEEPCNYAGKFPHPRVHLYYRQGASLGEAVYRSLRFAPFQMLFYGDPLTRPFAYLPEVVVNDAPVVPISGELRLVPTATTAHPSASIQRFDLLVDGRWEARANVGGTFIADTRGWRDGLHDVRVVAYDDTPVKSQGSWVGTIRTDNHQRSASLSVSPLIGDLGTAFAIEAGAAGGNVVALRLVCNNRVLAASAGTAPQWNLLGNHLGPGPVDLRVFADFADGTAAVSDPVALEIMPTGARSTSPGVTSPVAYAYRKVVARNQPTMIELPAGDIDGSSLSFTIHEAPSQASLAGTGPTRLLRPDAGASGIDHLTFSVSDGAAESAMAIVTIQYGFLAGDSDGDDDIDMADFAAFQVCYSTGQPQEPTERGCLSSFDWDVDDDVDSRDFNELGPALSGPR